MAKYMDSGGLSHFMGMLKDKYGEPEAPYTEVEWVESNGKQFVYLDWKPKIATWGFEADFIIRNAFNSTQAAWNASTNVSNAGAVFGVRNAVGVNNVEFSSYGTNGLLCLGGSSSRATSATFKKDKTRQTVKLVGTTLTNADGTTTTVTRDSEAANKPYCNMTVFAFHEGLRRAGSGSVLYPGTVRIYSLKFYDSSTLECNLVGAIRKSDGVTGLYDKVAGKFYPAPGCTHGNIVGDLGEPEALVSSIGGTVPIAYAYNASDTRMLRAEVPTLSKLEDGQQISLTYLYAIGASYQTTELAGWDDTGNNSSVYVKLTLADGSQTEWIPCFYNGHARLTTHYYSGSPLLLTYRENVFVGETTTGVGNGAFMRGFWCDPNYSTDDVYTRYSDTLIAGLNGVKRYSLNMRDANGNWTSIMNQDNNVNATGKTAYTGGLMLGNVLYHNSSANIAAGGNTGQMKESQGGVDFRYDVNGITNAAASTELQLRKPIYLVGTIGSDGLFYLDTTKWWTQTPDQTGKVYVQLGTAYNSYYAIFLSVDNPAFVYDGTRLVEFDHKRILALQAQLGSHTVASDVPANAVFTDTTYSAGTGLSLSGTTFSNSGATGVKGNSESSYRTGQVNLTAANVGAVATSGNETIAGNKTFSGSIIGNLEGGIKPSTVRPTSANTTGYGALLKYFLATSSMTEAKPDGDAHVLDMEWDSNGKWHGQLAIPTSKTGYMQWRSEGGGTWSSWYKVFDDAHTVPVANGGTGATTAADAWTALGGGAIGKKASLAATDIPAHASTATTYGAASTSNYGHAKLSSATDSSSEALAATPKAVKAAYDLATTANTTAGNALSAATGALAFKVTYSISNGTTTCAAHVYSAGAEVTSTFADSCFQWYYDIGSGWVSLGTGKTTTVTTLSDFGGNVKCDFTPPSS